LSTVRGGPYGIERIRLTHQVARPIGLAYRSLDRAQEQLFGARLQLLKVSHLADHNEP